MSDWTHGASGYTNFGCRCDVCTKAHRVAIRDQRTARSPLASDDPRHGKRSTYNNWSCRCDACKEAVRTARQRTASGRIKPFTIEDIAGGGIHVGDN